MIFLLAGSRPLPGYPAANLQHQPQLSDRPSQAELLEALTTDLCEAHEESGFYCAGLNAAYLRAKRLLRRVH